MATAHHSPTCAVAWHELLQQHLDGHATVFGSQSPDLVVYLVAPLRRHAPRPEDWRPHHAPIVTSRPSDCQRAPHRTLGETSSQSQPLSPCVLLHRRARTARLGQSVLYWNRRLARTRWLPATRAGLQPETGLRPPSSGSADLRGTTRQTQCFRNVSPSPLHSAPKWLARR